MQIDFNNGKIIVTEADSLRKYQLSQLDHWGFIAHGTSEIHKESDSPASDINKFIKYFQKEQVPFEVSEVVGSLIEQLRERTTEFNVLRERAKNLKDGVIDPNTFIEFSTFLNSLPRQLKDHQKKSAYHLYILGNGANFSVPGSGKTSVVLAVYERLRLEGKCNKLFVVGPSSCFQPWKNEFVETLGREPSSSILSGGDRVLRKAEYATSADESSELYLTSFQSILNDEEDAVGFLNQIGIDAFLVIDEAHYMKQIGGAWANTLLRLGSSAVYRCTLTGTPMPRSFRDIFNLFDFLWENDTPLDQASKLQIDIWEKAHRDNDAKELLDDRIGPLFYRVRKRDLGLLDPVFHEPIIVTMNSNERIIYDYVRSRIIEIAANDYLRNQDILDKLWKGRMIRLRQAVSHPSLLLSTIGEYDEELLDDSSLVKIIRDYDQIETPQKLLALQTIVMDLRKRGQKVLIWSNFVRTLEIIRDHFTSLGERCALIYGKTPVRGDNDSELNDEETRESIREEFIDPDSGLNILVANPAACAESISLHKTCFHAVYYDLSYNCAQYLQSMDRIHRVGGSENNIANYYFLQNANSIDQDIKVNLDRKAERMYNLIEKDYAVYDLDLFDQSLDDDQEAYKRLFLSSSESENPLQ